LCGWKRYSNRKFKTQGVKRILTHGRRIDDGGAVDDKIVAEGEEGGIGDIGAVLGSESQDDLSGDHVIEDMFAMGDGGDCDIVRVEKLIGGSLEELFGGVAETVVNGVGDPEGAPFWGEVVDGDEVVCLKCAGGHQREGEKEREKCVCVCVCV
jgi:hypothetical protein